MRHLITLMVSLSLVGCAPELDLQGHNPYDYYKKHPKVNKVETRTVSQEVQFKRGSQTLSMENKLKLREALRVARPEAGDAIEVQFSPGQLSNKPRREAMRRLLRSFGYTSPISYASTPYVGDDEARVKLTYAAVVLPDCPDWRRSPVTTYSNTSQANFGCATTVNLGLMVADPRDLVSGSGTTEVDTERATQAISNYRSGGAASSSASAPSSSSITPNSTLGLSNTSNGQ